jgi:hypothetical protein
MNPLLVATPADNSSEKIKNALLGLDAPGFTCLAIQDGFRARNMAKPAANEYHCTGSLNTDADSSKAHATYFQVGEVFSLLSAPTHFKMFLLAKNGLKFNFKTLVRLGISKKAFYNGLCALKHAGLIDKFGNVYFHTIFGKVIYKNVLEINAFRSDFLQTMKVLDAMRHANVLSEKDTAKVVETLTSTRVLSLHQAASKAFDLLKSLPSAAENNAIILTWSFDDMLRLVLPRIEQCEKRIFIATRLSSERLINSISHKAKHGIDVKILVDTTLISQYLSVNKVSEKNVSSKVSSEPGNKIGDDITDAERLAVVSNPWYPNQDIQRRSTELAFSFILLDDNTVGIELVNSHNPALFFGGFLTENASLSYAMNDIYQQLWDRGHPASSAQPVM